MPADRRIRRSDLEPINLTPLLDCILNLIFFFLLATTIKERMNVLEVEIPQSGVSSPAPEERRELEVTIAADGAIFLNDDRVTSAQLRTRLGDARTSDGQPLPVRIRSDKTAQAQVLVDVMSICLETSHPTFSLQVKPSAPLP